MIEPNRREIDDVEDWAAKAEASGRSNFPGMSYEEGVRATIEWFRGDAGPPNEE